jgi:hypothetical protein
MWLLALWSLLILAAVAVWARRGPQDPATQRYDDDAQARYLREWEEQRRER